MTNLEDREDLPAISHSGMETESKVSSQDELDLPALRRAMKLVTDAEKEASSMKTIDLKHPTLSAEQQIFAYQFALDAVILPFKATIQSAIDKVNNQNRGGS